MTMTATEAEHIRGQVTDSSDFLSIGRKLRLSDIIANYHADVKLKQGGSVFVKLSTGAFYVLDLA